MSLRMTLFNVVLAIVLTLSFTYGLVIFMRGDL